MTDAAPVISKVAVIVAGGSGARMNSEMPKQFLLLHGKPVLYYSIKAFLDAYNDLEVILVMPAQYIYKGQEIIDQFFDSTRVRITGGGDTRFHSVQNGLSLIEKDCIVFIHDAVRCLLTTKLISRCYDAAIEYGSAIPVIDCVDSMRVITETGNEIADRKKFKIVQTPQAFYSKIIIPAFNVGYNEEFTDEASVAEAFGLQLFLVKGEETNIKITYPVDMFLAEKILDERPA